MNRALYALFVDFDSYFASVEQHLQPHLRGKPVGVAPVMAESSCCIAASYEAKAFGVKTGTGVAEARIKCPGIAIVPARPELYVQYHHLLLEKIESCIHIEAALSIDEVWCWLPYNWRSPDFVNSLGKRIQQTIAKEVGPDITCSIGAGPNKWLAKMASKMNKPNGIYILEDHMLPDCLYSLELRDIHGVGRNIELRLHSNGIHSVRDLCEATMQQLRTAWGSIEGEILYRQLRGEHVTEKPSQRQSFGHSHVLPPEMRTPQLAIGVLHKLTQKAALRMRSEGYLAESLSVSTRLINKQSWSRDIHFDASDDLLLFSKCIAQIWSQRQQAHTPVLQLSVTLGKLKMADNYTPSLFQQQSTTQHNFNKAMESVIDKFGRESIFLGGAMQAMSSEVAPTRISFTHIPDL